MKSQNRKTMQFKKRKETSRFWLGLYLFDFFGSFLVLFLLILNFEFIKLHPIGLFMGGMAVGWNFVVGLIGISSMFHNKNCWKRIK